MFLPINVFLILIQILKTSYIFLYFTMFLILYYTERHKYIKALDKYTFKMHQFNQMVKHLIKFILLLIF